MDWGTALTQSLFPATALTAFFYMMWLLDNVKKSEEDAEVFYQLTVISYVMRVDLILDLMVLLTMLYFIYRGVDNG